tara:strand:+ start:30800 stop:31513 length:714 start_codon:yes stop_codon:yes gene_type:complete
MEVNMRRGPGSNSSEESGEGDLHPNRRNDDSKACLSELETLAQTQKKNSRICRNLTIATIPIAAILIFMSRPLIGYLSREICYYAQGPAPVPGYNPVNWAKWAWHGTSSLYKCEWMGHWGFNWLSVMQWFSDKGASIFTSLGVLGGSYATWKSITAWFKKKAMSDDDRDRLRELAQHIEVKETEGESPNIVSFTNTLHFSPPVSRDSSDSASAIDPSDLHNPNRKTPSALKSIRYSV